MMAFDRFIQWQGSARPTKAEVQTVIEDFLGAALQEIRWGGSRFTVLLHGTTTYPLVRTALDLPESYRLVAEEDRNRERWFEVFFHEEDSSHFSVITRRADEYTNTLADGLARLFARVWHGKVEQG